jgi:Zn finger protein HypA/HybF involved in hydrogenase expression
VVNVRLSPFSHVSAEGLLKTFREMVGAESYGSVSLNVLPLGIPLECKSCGRNTYVDKKIFGCPFCGSANISLQMDVEFFVESVEKESENEQDQR